MAATSHNIYSDPGLDRKEASQPLMINEESLSNPGAKAMGDRYRDNHNSDRDHYRSVPLPDYGHEDGADQYYRNPPTDLHTITNENYRPQGSEEFDNNYRGNGIADPENIHPTYTTSRGRDISPKGSLVRHRRKSTKKSTNEDEPDYEFDDETLPSQQYLKRARTKSLKERRQDLEEGYHHEGRERPPTLAERYAALKQKDEITAGNIATIMRDSTLTRINKLTAPTESKTWQKIKREWKEFSDRFTIWSSTLKEVEGKFGTAVMTYFRFIKWLMFLNLYIMIIMFCVITVPYLAMTPRDFNSSLTNPNVSGYSEALVCTQEYINYHDNLTSQESVGQQVLDFLQGTGWMERKVLFYGVYHNKTYKDPSDNSHTITYDMGLAYMLAVGACFSLCFLLIVKNSAKNVNVTVGREQSYARFSNKVFAGWDYCIVGKRPAKTKRNNIWIDLVAILREQRKEWKYKSRKLNDKCKLIWKRILVNLIIICLLGGALYLIAFTAEEMIAIQQQGNLSEIVELLVQYVPFVTITVLNLLLPIVFQKLVTVEEYKYAFEINITLARSILLRLASPIALFAILYKELIEIADNSESVGICGNKQWSAISSSVRGSIRCWETYFGQQLYKLVLLDLIVEGGIIFFVQAPRSYLHKRYHKSFKLIAIVGPQEFDLPQSVVDIIYTQSLCWLGLFFSPLIPFMTFVKCLLFFYIKKVAVLKISVPQKRPLKTSRSNSLFMTVLLLSFMVAAIPIGYMIGNIQPSQSCGPYRVYNSTSEVPYVMFDVITNTVHSWPTEARDIFRFLGTVGFFVPVIILLCLLMYYYWLLGQGFKKTEKIMQQQLKLEAKDKKYLLARVNEVLDQNADVLASS